MPKLPYKNTSHKINSRSPGQRLAPKKRINLQKERQGKSISHQVEIKLEVRDLEALHAACRELKLSFARAQQGQKIKARAYGSALVDADAVITLAGNHDVALHRQPNGTYKMEVDYYPSYMPNGTQILAADQIGVNGKKLTQYYGIHAATLAARRLGHNVTRQPGKNGIINLCITGARL